MALTKIAWKRFVEASRSFVTLHWPLVGFLNLLPKIESVCHLTAFLLLSFQSHWISYFCRLLNQLFVICFMSDCIFILYNSNQRLNELGSRWIHKKTSFDLRNFITSSSLLLDRLPHLFTTSQLLSLIFISMATKRIALIGKLCCAIILNILISTNCFLICVYFRTPWFWERDSIPETAREIWFSDNFSWRSAQKRDRYLTLFFLCRKFKQL